MNEKENIEAEKNKLSKKQKYIIDSIVTSALMLGGVLTLVGLSPVSIADTVGLVTFYVGARFFPSS